MRLKSRLLSLVLAVMAASSQSSFCEVIAEFNAKESGKGIQPDTARYPWELRGRGMTNTGEVLLQDTTDAYPKAVYGSYSSPHFKDLMQVDTGEYGVEFTIRPLSHHPEMAASLYQNLMVVWGDVDRSFRMSIVKEFSDDKSKKGGITSKDEDSIRVIEGVDWSRPHTIFVGYRGDKDEVDFYLDGKLTKTVAAQDIASEPEDFYEGKVAFGDFTSGQAAPFNKDLKAEWYSVKISDQASPEGPSSGQSRVAAPRPPTGEALPSFSSLEPTRQLAIRDAVAPPEISKRQTPYSTPMYYPMWGEKRVPGSSPDGRFHPEWQDVIIRDWAELGMTKLHLTFWPPANYDSARTYTISDDEQAGMLNLASLAEKYGMKVGLRFDLPMEAGSYWPAHPRNPKNELTSYKKWIEEVLGIFGENVEYVILGDEIDELLTHRVEGKTWEWKDFHQLVEQISSTIHAKNPNTLVSTPSFGTGNWRVIMDLVRNGFHKVGGAVAINLEDSSVISKYAQELREASKDAPLAFLSNGVGYIGAALEVQNPPDDNRYSKYKDEDQAGLIAQSMYLAWDARMVTAPYYVALRDIEYQGKRNSLWYGFLGFEDLVIDHEGRAEMRRHPGWYSFQTIAQTFYDVAAFQDAPFSVAAKSKRAAYLKAHLRKDGRELLIILWGSGKTDIVIDSTQFGYPVKIDLLNKDRWTDVPAVKVGHQTILTDIELPGARMPVILRLVASGMGQ